MIFLLLRYRLEFITEYRIPRYGTIWDSIQGFVLSEWSMRFRVKTDQYGADSIMLYPYPVTKKLLIKVVTK